MQIIGKRYLDDNSYQIVKIHASRIIFISYANEVETIKSTHEFSDDFHGKSNDEIINMVIDHFLRYNTISYISNDCIMSLSGKRLYAYSMLDIDTINKVRNKYFCDRKNYFYDSEVKKYNVSVVNMASYYTKDNRYYLNEYENAIDENDLEFLKEMIDYVFKDDIAYLASLYKKNNSVEIISLKDSNKTIKLNNNLMNNFGSEICNIISNHNNNLDNKKEKQLRLEI